MRTLKLLYPLAALVVPLSLPLPAFAQTTGAGAAGGAAAAPSVQPVPYASSQPVPYPVPPPPPPGVSAPPETPLSVGPLAPVGGDIVYLKDGGMIRGTLLEAIPDDHATVQLATGQSAIIPWVRVARIDRSKAPSAAPGVPAPSSPEPAAIVHVNADRQVVLERRDPGGGPWTLACSSPCDIALPISSTYRVAGAGVRNTRPFHLDAHPDEHVTIDVNPASRGAFAGGIAMASAGLGAMVSGFFVLVVVQANDDEAAAFGTHSTDTTATAVGWAFVAGGAALTVGGALLIGTNAHSKERQQQPPQADASRRPPPKSTPRTDAWLRAPTWHDDKAGGSLAPKVVTEVPLFHGTF